ECPPQRRHLGSGCAGQPCDGPPSPAGGLGGPADSGRTSPACGCAVARLRDVQMTGPGSPPLSGIIILDLTRVLAGPFCTLVLANLGARVIKVEMPGRGDDARAFGPFVDGQSLYFSALNYDKESIALDLKSPDDRAIFDKLLARADVLVENFRPGTMEDLG